jgi:hypothetical protein
VELIGVAHFTMVAVVVEHQVEDQTHLVAALVVQEAQEHLIQLLVLLSHMQAEEADLAEKETVQQVAQEEVQ